MKANKIRIRAVGVLLAIAEAFDKAANRLAGAPELPQVPLSADERGTQMAFDLLKFAQTHQVHGALTFTSADSPIVVWIPNGNKAAALRAFATRLFRSQSPSFIADPPPAKLEPDELGEDLDRR